jgi:hypothetical protein
MNAIEVTGLTKRYGRVEALGALLLLASLTLREVE